MSVTSYSLTNGAAPEGKKSFSERIIGWVQGKTTGWLFAFFVCGHVAHYFHRLDATYITFMTTFMGFVLGHSIKEDYFK